MNAKRKGSYYTSSSVVDFVLNRINFGKKRDLKILEPSSGDGAFFDGLLRSKKIKNKNCNVTCIDIDNTALSCIKEKDISKYKLFSRRCLLRDFLKYKKGVCAEYDLVIGNPPYVHRRYLSNEQIDLCQIEYGKAGFSNARVHNLWAAFLLKSIGLLKDDGVLAFVLPAEFLQVSFTELLRNYVKDSFSRVEVYTFSELLFDAIEQDAIVLIAYKSSSFPGLYMANVEDVSISDIELRSYNNRVSNKWNCSLLCSAEVRLLEKLKAKTSVITKYCDSSTGIVTAANDFFIVNRHVCDSFNLHSYSKPIVQKGMFINGDLTFSESNFKELDTSDLPCYLLDFNGIDAESFGKKVKDYLRIGEERNISQRYKCLQRNRWFDVPSVYLTEAFFFKRVHQYPKLIKNSYNAYVTDSAYRVKMKSEYSRDIDSLIFSFYNTFTLCMAELSGRYYGGGVLELTPSEFKSLYIPFVQVDKKIFNGFVKRFSSKSNIAEISKYVDDYILRTKLGVSERDLKALRSIYDKLISRRLRK